MSTVATPEEPEEQEEQDPAAEVVSEAVTASTALADRVDRKPACNEITHELRAAMSKWIKFCMYCGQKLNS
jgi:hypothetical protein